jgi:DNA mismatch repair protein MutL
LNNDVHERLVRAMVKNTSIKQGQSLSPEAMTELINDLFACEKPYLSIEGKPTVVVLSANEINTLFRK